MFKSKKFIVFAVTAVLLGQAAFALAPRDYPDNTYQDIPADGYKFVENGGNVIRWIYEVPSTKPNDTKKTYRKSALVYLPYGYDENAKTDQYNVLYLVHGHQQSPEFFFTGAYCGSLTKSLLDNLHDKGEIKNLIVCAISYYGGQFNDSMGNSMSFYKELKESIMPEFEKKFHIIKDREHRAYGGFSLGSMTTWLAFENCLDDIAFYIPISSNSWALGGGMQSADQDALARYLEKKVLMQNKTKDDFKIYAGCGEQEMATAAMVSQFEGMKKLPDTFLYSENFSEGNIYFILCKGSGHDQVTVLRTLYNALPKFFK